MEMDEEPGETRSIKYAVGELRKVKLILIRVKTSFYHRRP